MNEKDNKDRFEIHGLVMEYESDDLKGRTGIGRPKISVFFDEDVPSPLSFRCHRNKKAGMFPCASVDHDFAISPLKL